MSTAADQSRRPGRRIGSARPVKVLLTGLVGLLAIVLGGLPASAYWTSTGAGAAGVQTGMLAPPAVSVPANVFTDVPVRWTAGTGGVAPQGYYVTRHSGATSTAVCGSSPIALRTGTSCTDPGVPDGDYTYIVTAVFRSWTAPSASSPTVTVVNPTRLGFLVQPVNTTAGAAITPAVSVRLLSAAGSAVAYAGIPITLAIEANPSVGSLAGTTTVLTLADGTATFSNLRVDRPGIGYTLTATSPVLTSDTSNPFDVLPRPPLGEASSYSVLGGAGVVNTLSTTVSGDLGVSSDPGVVVTGFEPVGPGTVGGDIHRGDADASKALADAATAYAAMWALPAGTSLVGDLGGTTLTPGNYRAGAASAITGTLTLDAQNDPDAVFIIRVNAALDEAAAGDVVMARGARAANVYWVINGAVTLGANSHFEGTILAQGAITIGDSTTLVGRALSVAAVTMANNIVRFTTALPRTLAITRGATFVTKDTTPDISGTTDAPLGTAVKVTVDGQTLVTTVKAGGTWTVTAAALLASSYEVVAQVRDAAGNATKAVQTIVIEVNPAPVNLRSAASFSVLANGSVTNTLASTLSGDLGLIGTLSTLTGFPPGTVAGTIHDKDTAAGAAETDLQTAMTNAAGRAPHTQFAGDLGGRTFHVGVHHSLAAVGLTGTVTLDGEGDEDAVFIFQIGGALTGAADCQVNLVNGATADNVFWVVNGAAGTGASCVFRGNLLTTGAITLGLDTNLEGRGLSRSAVTLATNTITGATPAPAARSGRPAPTAEPTPSVESTLSPSASVEPSPSASPSVEPTPSESPSAEPSPSESPTAEPTPIPTPTPIPSAVEQDGAP